MDKLKVYYGWCKIGKVRKKRALSVMFENDKTGCRSERGQRCLRTMQETVIERFQDEDEQKESKSQNRIFTEYCIFLDEKTINGSLNRLLIINSESDKNHVSRLMRDKISDALRKAFLVSNLDYKEPGRQLNFNFKED